MKGLRIALFVDLALFGYFFWQVSYTLYVYWYTVRHYGIGAIAGGGIPLAGLALTSINAIAIAMILRRKQQPRKQQAKRKAPR